MLSLNTIGGIVVLIINYWKRHDFCPCGLLPIVLKQTGLVQYMTLNYKEYIPLYTFSHLNLMYTASSVELQAAECIINTIKTK